MERYEREALGKHIPGRLTAEALQEALQRAEQRYVQQRRAHAFLKNAVADLQAAHRELTPFMPASARLIASEITALRVIQALILGTIIDETGEFPVPSNQQSDTPTDTEKE